MLISKITEHEKDIVLAKTIYVIVYTYGSGENYEVYTFSQNESMKGVMDTINAIKNDPSTKTYRIKEAL